MDAQQYLDVMSALDSKMVMEQLIASLPPYAECGVNHTDAYIKKLVSDIILLLVFSQQQQHNSPTGN